MLTHLQSSDLDSFIKIGMEYADSVIKTNENFGENINALFNEFVGTNKSINTISADDNLCDSYFNLYNELSR
jgi:starch synthase